MVHVNNIYRYAVKHYAEHRNKYLALMLGMFGLPLLLSYMSKGVESSGVMATFVLLFALLYVNYLSTYAMRTRRAFVVENTLPITAAERYVFVLANSTVVAVTLFVVSYVPSFLIAEWLFPPAMDVNAIILEAVVDSSYLMGIFALQSVILVASLIMRKRVVLSYCLLAVLVIGCEFVVDAYVPYELRDTFRLWSNVALIVACWVSGYFILRSREIKM